MKDLKSVHAYGIKQLDIESFNDCVAMDTNMTRNPSANKELIYTSQKMKRYTSFYFYNIFNTNNIL